MKQAQSLIKLPNRCTIQQRNFSLATLFSNPKQNPGKDLVNCSSSIQSHLISYPWLTSKSPPRIPTPSVWQSFKEKHFRRIGFAKVEKLIPGYDFPRQFPSESLVVVQDLFKALSDPEKTSNAQELVPYFSFYLADQFSSGTKELLSKGLVPSYTLGSSKLHVTGFHFTQGPYPPPPDYIAQHWWSLMTFVIPKQDAEFDSYERQKEIVKQAEEEGVYIRVQARLNGNVDFTLRDKESGQIVYKDRKYSVNLEFSSPHFTPWDELSELDKQGDWMLRWKWRVTDVDFLLASQETKMNKQPRIEWSLPGKKKEEQVDQGEQPELLSEEKREIKVVATKEP